MLNAKDMQITNRRMRCFCTSFSDFTQDVQSTNPNNHVCNFYLAIVSLYYQTMLWHITCVVFLEVCDVAKVTVPKSGYKPNMIVQILNHPLTFLAYLGEPNVKI
jgi:hypothetical protein